MNKRKPDIEYSYSKISIPKELIYAYDSDFPTEDESEKEHLKCRKKKERTLEKDNYHMHHSRTSKRFG